MESNFLDKPVSFPCDSNMLQGIVSEPQQSFDRAVIIVVGGPQFRVGSHRQFVLLARYLAAQVILALRFDYTGMGYGDGWSKKFYEIDQDIHSAITFVGEQYPQVTRIFLWGLCDAASAILFTAHTSQRIDGIVISNPWVRSDASHSEAILKNYYRDRIFSWDVWSQLLSSPSKIFKAVISLLNICFKVLLNLISSTSSKDQLIEEITQDDRQNNLAASVLTGMSRFKGRICLLLSEKDLTADEFRSVFESSDWMQNADNAKKITIHNLDGVDHTFSSSVWRAQVEHITKDFVCI